MAHLYVHVTPYFCPMCSIAHGLMTVLIENKPLYSCSQIVLILTISLFGLKGYPLFQISRLSRRGEFPQISIIYFFNCAFFYVLNNQHKILKVLNLDITRGGGIMVSMNICPGVIPQGVSYRQQMKACLVS